MTKAEQAKLIRKLKVNLRQMQDDIKVLETDNASLLLQVKSQFQSLIELRDQNHTLIRQRDSNFRYMNDMAENNERLRRENDLLREKLSKSWWKTGLRRGMRWFQLTRMGKLLRWSRLKDDGPVRFDRE